MTYYVMGVRVKDGAHLPTLIADAETVREAVELTSTVFGLTVAQAIELERACDRSYALAQAKNVADRTVLAFVPKGLTQWTALYVQYR